MAECLHSYDGACQAVAAATHCLPVIVVNHEWNAVLTTQWPGMHKADPVTEIKFGHLPIRYNANSESTFNLTLS